MDDELTIERDARVLAGGREIGRVAHVIVDPQTKEVAQVVVAHDGGESAIPVALVASAGGRTVRLREGANPVLRGDFAREAFHGLDDRTADAASAGVAAHGGAPLRDAQPDAVVVARPEATPARAARPADVTSATAAVGRHEGEIRVPVAEERLTVGKREVDLGEVDIRKTVTEEEQAASVTLHRDEVHVQEVDVADRPLRAGEDAFEEGTIRVRLRGEEAVVAKEAVVTGEVVVDKETIAEERRITDTVRRQHVEVEETTVGGTATTGQQARDARARDTRRG
jgi:uncharacterized protein (TIGR02271 family)